MNMDEIYIDLVHAIIVQACKDYRNAVKRNDVHTKSEIEVFFKSRWFKTISPSMSGDTYLYLLRKEQKENEVQVKKQPRQSRFFA